MSALLEKRERGSRRHRETDSKTKADICKSNSSLAVMNSVSGHLGSGEEIIAYNRLEISNGLRVRWSGQ